jgi:hypothetical protein
LAAVFPAREKFLINFVNDRTRKTVDENWSASAEDVEAMTSAETSYKAAKSARDYLAQKKIEEEEKLAEQQVASRKALDNEIADFEG